MDVIEGDILLRWRESEREREREGEGAYEKTTVTALE